MMQEQERAHFLISGGAFDSLGLDSVEGSVQTNAAGENEFGAVAGQYSEEDTSDEALAWRLMQEEQQAFNQRLMALASAHNFLAYYWCLVVGHPAEVSREGETEGEGDDPLADAPQVEQMSYE
eukprot:scaffold96720_cov42-Prasinocladus_malaysianus.AAC.1